MCKANSVNEGEENVSKNHGESYNDLKQQVEFLLNQHGAKLIAEINVHAITKTNLAKVELDLRSETEKRKKLEDMVNKQQGKLQLQENKLKSQDALMLEQSAKINRLEQIINEARLEKRTNACTCRLVKVLGGIVIGSAIYFWIKN